MRTTRLPGGGCGHTGGSLAAEDADRPKTRPITEELRSTTATAGATPPTWRAPCATAAGRTKTKRTTTTGHRHKVSCSPRRRKCKRLRALGRSALDGVPLRHEPGRRLSDHNMATDPKPGQHGGRARVRRGGIQRRPCRVLCVPGLRQVVIRAPLWLGVVARGFVAVLRRALVWESGGGDAGHY